ncbi:S8 family serine peptidase [Catellatospora sichuanensis]|uniref:S8 family serine peptidase n=1 Tax=Catellatospora sichuanensis TaxID=1969805 RepID=UPI001FE81611|nr:S8 family serine peptidase [Catellatospora sichuanensis]
MPPSAAADAPPRPPVGAIVAAVVVGVWAVAVAVLSQYGIVLAAQVLAQLGMQLPGFLWPLAGIMVGLLVGVPALILALLPKHEPVRATGRAFFLGALVLGGGSALRLIPATANELYLLSYAVLAGAAAFLLYRRATARPAPAATPPADGSADAPAADGAAVAPAADRPEAEPVAVTATGSPAPSSGDPAALAWAVLAGVLVLVPYLWAGALGGFSESIAAALAALGAGALAMVILGPGLWRHFTHRGRPTLVLAGGLVAGVVLALIAGGTGAAGTQVLTLLVLPPLGFAVAALAPGSPRGWTTLTLVALAAFGPLGFVDPDELNLALIGRDVPYYALLAALIAWLVALALGVAYGIGLLRTVHEPVVAPEREQLGPPSQWPGARPAGTAWPGAQAQWPGAPAPIVRERRHVVPRTGGRTLAAGLAAAVAVGAGVYYLAAGQPGFFGDQLFVVLKEQAPLTGLPTTTGLGAGRDQRVDAVYRRLVEHADRTQAALRTELDRWNLDYQPFYLVNAILVDGGPEARVWLESRSDVDRVLTDQRLRPLPAEIPIGRGPVQQPPTTPQWNLKMVGAPDLWQRGVTGKGIVVGSSDSGVDGSHPALAANFRGGDDSWLDPWSDSRTPIDHNGHGTHTTATAVGRERVGVAPDAQWIGCVNLERNMSSPSLYLDCMQFMLAPYPHGGNPFTDGRPARAPHVLNNSWGCPPLEGCDSTVLQPATSALAAAGIAFVAAAGNTGPDCGTLDTPPATDPASITIAAVDRTRRITSFSSRGPAGPKPDLAGPGEAVLSAMPGGTYAELSGTSMATPHVAGVIALLWSAHPELVGDLARTQQLLRDTAQPAMLATAAPPCATEAAQAGSGIVNAAEAVVASAR